MTPCLKIAMSWNPASSAFTFLPEATSSTVGTEALGVKKANVLGQICPGIPVWQTDETSKFPKIPYVIFPGNVGDADTLRQAVEILTEA